MVLISGWLVYIPAIDQDGGGLADLNTLSMCWMSLLKSSLFSSNSRAIPAHCAPWPVNTKVTSGDGEASRGNSCKPTSVSEETIANVRYFRCSLLAPRVWATSFKSWLLFAKNPSKLRARSERACALAADNTSNFFVVLWGDWASKT